MQHVVALMWQHAHHSQASTTAHGGQVGPAYIPRPNRLYGVPETFVLERTVRLRPGSGARAL